MFLGLSDITWIIIAGALATYATRVGGYLVLSRFEHIPRRVSAALDAVPAAVLTTLVAPAAVSHGPAELIALAIAGFAALRFGLVTVLAIGTAAIIALRAMGLG